MPDPATSKLMWLWNLIFPSTVARTISEQDIEFLEDCVRIEDIELIPSAEPPTRGTRRGKSMGTVKESVTGPKPPMTYFETLMHLIKGFLGTGIFAMGYGFSMCGTITGTVLFVALAALNLHSQHALISVVDRVAERHKIVGARPTYAETVKYTIQLGPEFLRPHAVNLSLLATCISYCSEMGVCCVCYVFVVQHVNDLLFEYNIRLGYTNVFALCFFPMWISAMSGSLKTLTPLSMFANILMLLGIFTIFYFVSQQLVKVKYRKKTPSRYEDLPAFFGTVMFAFEGVSFILPLRNEMEQPNDFVKPTGVMNVGIPLASILYGTVGFMSYWKYGDEIHASVFRNFDIEDPLVQCVFLVISAAVLCSYALHMYIPFEVTYPIFFRKYGPFKRPRLVRVAFRTVPVLITFVFGIVLPELELFITLTGSLFGGLLSIVPHVLYLVVFWREMSIFTAAKNFIISLIGVFGTVTGIILSISRLLDEYDVGNTHR